LGLTGIFCRRPVSSDSGLHYKTRRISEWTSDKANVDGSFCMYPKGDIMLIGIMGRVRFGLKILILFGRSPIRE